ncbi:hypothetical protein JR316_0003115 [Psilocybe cubensis]|uniref:Uncharacterized protein n=2 Tax=Psilocybe cubensis TaxID=181762 RepID=A0ACB8H7F4_PSICU|nr:hypothetical protein JR316_0003115 [Psilocybe cubensis]KAH9483645.1 hypothetical protein JR316_0003115 [Psilocybe cubensis]
MSSMAHENAALVAKREIPKINGSATVLVVVLVLIILVACSAIAYILRADMAEDEEALTQSSRGRYRISREGQSYPKRSRNWLSDILHLPRSRQRSPKMRSDKPRIVVGHAGQGWIPAGSGNDFDFDSSDNLPSQKRNQSTPTKTRLADQDTSSLATPRSSIAGSQQHVSRMYSSTSDATSSVRFDPHSLRGLSYADTSLSAQGIIPSIQSQLYSPPSSPSLSPIPHDPSQTPLTTLESLKHSRSLDSLDGPSQLLASTRPSVRTFEGGTKFIEAL